MSWDIVNSDIDSGPFGLIKWFVLFFIVMVLLGLCFKVISAPSRVINKTLGTDNIIQSYEWYFDANAAYVARVSQIRQFEIWLADETDDNELRRLKVELSAMQQSCRELSADYTSNSSKLNKEFFKSKKLPDSLNPANCEINK